MGLNGKLLASIAWGSAISAFAHGVIESPPSRNWICGAVTKPDEVIQGSAKNPICSTAFAVNPLAGYNFMSVVTHTLGRSTVTPLPKNVCGFDGETWKGAETPWDVPMEWPTNPMSAGPKTFTWNITWGPHFDDTDDLSFWITKADFVFSPTTALTWNDFETEPFCTEKYDDKKPTANPNVTADKGKGLLHTKCTLPERKGHHVVYSEWGRIAPTFERFHGCVDASFGAASSIGSRRVPGTQSIEAPDPKQKQSDLLGRNRKPGSGVFLIHP